MGCYINYVRIYNILPLKQGHTKRNTLFQGNPWQSVNMEVVCLNRQSSLFPEFPVIEAPRCVRETPAYRVSTTPDNCSLQELLSVLIGGHRSEEKAFTLIQHYGTISRMAASLNGELEKIIGKSAALRLKAGLVLGRRAVATDEDRPGIHNPANARDILWPLIGQKDQENLAVLVVDTRNRLIEARIIYQGSVNASIVRVSEILRPAIVVNAPAIVLGHNHPSGIASASPEDITLTRALKTTCKTFDLDLLDHIIVTPGSAFISMKEKGLGF